MGSIFGSRHLSLHHYSVYFHSNTAKHANDKARYVKARDFPPLIVSKNCHKAIQFCSEVGCRHFTKSTRGPLVNTQKDSAGEISQEATIRQTPQGWIILSR